MKEQILQLHNQNKTYREIQKILGCSRGLISYYVNPNRKELKNKTQNRNRFTRRTKYKTLLGGKCVICGYNKCMNALQFHHTDPSQKKFEISDAIFNRKHGNYSEDEIIKELDKCILLCSNCHFELHSKNNFTQ